MAKSHNVSRKRPSIASTSADDCKHVQLALVQGTGAAGSRPVAQALDTLLVVAVHPVAKRLPGHSGEPRCFLSGQAVERVGQSKQAGADPTVALAAGETAQLGRVVVGADHQG